MKLTFIGVGSAFALNNYNSNMLLEDTVKRGDGDYYVNRMLIDCGCTAQRALFDRGLVALDIDDVYISHQHADHIGGMEWLGFSRYFMKSKKALPRLFVNEKLASSLWNDSLRGGMKSIQGEILELDSFFDVRRIRRNKSFQWGDGEFQPIQTVHIMDGYDIVPSYGLFVTSPKGKAFITTDTQFCPRQIEDFYNRADIIFQDCEAAPYKSGVHAHYDDLRTLPDATKKKMWLYHYPDAVNEDDVWHKRAAGDGFAGFVQKGQMFEI
jgi:ribonuclease BN (tRNA processing enzyme)